MNPFKKTTETGQKPSTSSTISAPLQRILDGINWIDFMGIAYSQNLSIRHQLQKTPLTKAPDEPSGERIAESLHFQYDANIQIWRRTNIEAVELLRMLHNNKVSVNQYIDIVTTEITKRVKNDNLLFFHGKSSVFLYDGCGWDEVNLPDFHYFLEKSAEKMGVPDITNIGNEMCKVLINNIKPPYLDEKSEVTGKIRELIKNQ